MNVRNKYVEILAAVNFVFTRSWVEDYGRRYILKIYIYIYKLLDN